MEIVRVNLNERSYPIYIQLGALDQLGSLYQKHALGRRAALIADETVRALYAGRALESLTSAGIQTALITLPAGEAQKSIQAADLIYGHLIESTLDRSAAIIALGGGVIGDLAGFVAATFLRGIAFVQVPTTLIAQVDSSVGGKTGVNHRLGKNLIGAFYQPKFVLIDPLLLKTLPPREVWSGLSEVIKYGLIRDFQLFEQLERDLAGYSQLGDPQALSRLIARCCQIKAEITSQDEKESNLRKILNFGHTIGHALEAVSHFELRHGEAIAWGMRAAAWLSHKKKALTEAEFTRIVELFAQFPAPPMDAYDSDAIIENTYRDKKARDGRIHFVLLKHIGEAYLCPDVREPEIREALNYLRTLPQAQT